MTIPRIVELDGEQLTLRQLARRSGIAYPTLCRRWHTGDRGEDLIRPLSPGRQSKQQVDLAEMRNTKRELLRQRHLAKLAKEETRRKQLCELREQRVELLTRPLISADLLTGDERQQIRSAITGRRQRWSALGEARS